MILEKSPSIPLLLKGEAKSTILSQSPQLGATNNQKVKREEAELGLGVPRATGTIKNQFWMREYWDCYMRDEKHFHSTIDYIHNNPVKAELCAELHDWPWSSAYAGHR